MKRTRKPQEREKAPKEGITQIDPQILAEAYSRTNGPTEADLQHTTESPHVRGRFF